MKLKLFSVILLIILSFSGCDKKPTKIMNGIYLGMTVPEVEEYEGKIPEDGGALNVWKYGHTKYDIVEGWIEYSFIGETEDDYKLNSVTFNVPYFSDYNKILLDILQKQYGDSQKQDDSQVWKFDDLIIFYYDLPDDETCFVSWMTYN